MQQRSVRWFGPEALALVALAVGLAWHVWVYRFLTDDAYISFRFARNFAEGHGFVFNIGSEPVEGYTNFLWVLVLGLLDRAGVPPEVAAPALGVLSTGLLWLGAVIVGGRWLPADRSRWFMLIAPLALAVNRSFAVWSTSGLETRFVELMILGGLFALATVVNSRNARRPALAGSILLALAVLTRLDSIIIAVGALLACGVILRCSRRLQWREQALRSVVFIVPIAMHFVWRMIYYGYPLPNTYYAKLADQSSVSLGLMYLAFFVVEYALILWIPFIVDGFKALRRWVPGVGWILGCSFIPYLAYVVYAGGDHFEFRFLDVYWIPLALVFQCGVAYRLERLRNRVARIGFVGLSIGVVGASAVLPILSHLDFPEGNLAGFPGFRGRPTGDQNLIRPEVAPAVFRWPGFRDWLGTYNDLARILTSHYAALRQESHKQAAEVTAMLGHQLRGLVDAGYIPEDTKIAIGAVGAIPYYSQLWTLDRVGLCDAHVAHSKPLPGRHMLAHSKMAEPWYIAMSGVELNAVHPYSFIVQDETVQRTKDIVVPQGSQNYWVVRLGPDRNFLAHFPQGPERTLPRFPRLHFIPIADWEPLDSNRQ